MPHNPKSKIQNPKSIKGRRIIVGLTGGIACYKVANVVSALTQAGAEVDVAMTDAAMHFIMPLTFEAISGRAVFTSQWSSASDESRAVSDELMSEAGKDHASLEPRHSTLGTWHITTARAAHLMLVAPCSMDMLGKLATGRTDDPVSLIASAMDLRRQPILLAPSMNEIMWNQASTQRNLAQLQADGFEILHPETGWQACRTEGVGRLPEPEQLVQAVCAFLDTRPATVNGRRRHRGGRL